MVVSDAYRAGLLWLRAEGSELEASEKGSAR